MNRVPRFYHDGALSAGEPVALEGSAHHHLAHVLRMRSGDPIRLFNGDGREYAGRLRGIDRHRAVVGLESVTGGLPPSPLHTVLAIGISKPKHFDLALQKATELGATRILPLAASRSPGHELRGSGRQRTHWEGVMISACEQCGRAELPVIGEATDVSQLAGDPQFHGHARLLLDPDGAPLQGSADPGAGVVICGGPEGGFTDAEKEQLRDGGFLPVSCGPRILRTETTPLAMLALVQYLWGDLG